MFKKIFDKFKLIELYENILDSFDYGIMVMNNENKVVENEMVKHHNAQIQIWIFKFIWRGYRWYAVPMGLFKYGYQR